MPTRDGDDGRARARARPYASLEGDARDYARWARACAASRGDATTRDARDARRGPLRRRFDVALDALLAELRAHEDAEPFAVPVDARYAPDYYAVIERPIDVATMRARAGASAYASKDAFAEDLALMEANAVAYNGAGSTVAKMARAVVGAGEEMLRHVPRVDFETCERVAAYAARVERGETLEGEGESESESESEETRENAADEPGTKSWRKRPLETRVRRVLRATALADAPVGTRRACRPRSARGMLEFMRASEDHVDACVGARAFDDDDDDDDDDALPEDEGFVANAVPTLPKYSATAECVSAEALDDMMMRSIAVIIDARSRVGKASIEYSMTSAAAKLLLSVADDFTARISVDVAKALAARELERKRERARATVNASGINVPEIAHRIGLRADVARVAARAIKKFLERPLGPHPRSRSKT